MPECLTRFEEYLDENKELFSSTRNDIYDKSKVTS